MKTNELLGVVLLLVFSLSTLTIYSFFDYPFHVIPDTFAQLGEAKTIIELGHILPTYSTSYLFFPNFHILMVEISYLVGVNLLASAPFEQVIVTLFYALVTLLIMKLLTNSYFLALLVAFIVIATNTPVPSIFAVSSYFNFPLFLLGVYLALKLLLRSSRHDPSSSLLALVSSCLVIGDPIYSIPLVGTLGVMWLIFVPKNKTRIFAARLLRPSLLIGIMLVSYVAFVGFWILSQFPNIAQDLWIHLFSNFRGSLLAPSQPAGSGILGIWLSVSTWISRTVYFFTAILGTLMILQVLLSRTHESNFSQSDVVLSVTALSVSVASFILIGVGTVSEVSIGGGPFLGRFIEISYPFFTLLTVRFTIIHSSSFSRRTNMALRRALVFALIMSIGLAYFPIHLTAHNVTDNQIVYSAYYLAEKSGNNLPVNYNLPVYAVLQYITTIPLLSVNYTPAGTITMVFIRGAASETYHGWDSVYENGIVDVLAQS